MVFWCQTVASSFKDSAEAAADYLEVLLQLLFFSEFLEVTTSLGLLPLLGKLSGNGARRRDGGEEERERSRKQREEKKNLKI